MTSSPGRARIGLVSVRFTLFDPQMGPGFPVRMRAHVERSATILEKHFEVVRTPLIESEEDAASVAEQLASEHLDAVVFAPAMAAPPSYAQRALAGTRAPLVIWNAPSILRLPEDLHQDEATVHSTTVGALMYGNVRVREGRPVPVVTAAHDDEGAVVRLLRTVRAVAAAGALGGATFLRVGEPIPGYLDVEAAPEDLARLGVREESIALEDWEARVRSVPDSDAEGLLRSATSRWSGDPGPQALASARIAVALGHALDTSGAIGGTVNCHGPWFRRSESVGLTACLGVACQTEAGRPISCTGDQPTAIVLTLARRMAGAALYCETYAPEIETGLVLVAAGGEGDPAWAEPAGSVRLEANDHYPGARGEATSIAFALRPGPATLLSLSPDATGWVLAWAPGEIVETRYTDMRGPNGMFRFDSGHGAEALSRWIVSGATHHNALAPDRLDVEVPALAQALGIREARV
jgi:L-arabinose isomerase